MHASLPGLRQRVDVRGQGDYVGDGYRALGLLNYDLIEFPFIVGSLFFKSNYTNEGCRDFNFLYSLDFSTFSSVPSSYSFSIFIFMALIDGLRPNIISSWLCY